MERKEPKKSRVTAAAARPITRTKMARETAFSAEEIDAVPLLAERAGEAGAELDSRGVASSK